MRNTVIRLCNATDARPYLATLGNKVVVGVDHEEGSDLFMI